MKKTAIQQAIEKITKRGNSIPPMSSIGTGLSMAINILKEFLPEERQQIEEAVRDTIENEYYRNTWANCGPAQLIASDYYTEKYGE